MAAEGRNPVGTDRTVIRVKAFAVILDEDGTHHAVARMSTPEQPAFHRPLGGSIELGEHSGTAVVRELAEELEATRVEPELLGVLENVFAIDGEFPDGLQALIEDWLRQRVGAIDPARGPRRP